MGNITELKQESLNGLLRQVNECIAHAYNKGYEDGAKEQDEVQYQNGYKVGQEDGYSKGIADRKDALFTEEEMNKVANNEYNRGYNTAIDDYNTMVECIHNCTLAFRDFLVENGFYDDLKEVPTNAEDILYEIICGWNLTEIINEFKEWQEELKQAEEVKVGDIVKFNKKCHSYETKKNREFLVLHKFKSGIVTLFYDNGDTGAVDIGLLDKTGRHIDETEQLLDKLKGDK